MKKQTNSSIKAQFLRGAFILLSLLALCAIPLALAQRNAKSSVTKGAAKAISAADMYSLQNAPPSAGMATADQPAYQGDSTSRSDVPFLKPQTAVLPEVPAICSLNGTLGTAPPGGNTGTLATRITRPGTPTSNCAGVTPPNPFNLDAGPFIYNVHNITNSSGTPLCTTVVLHVVTEGTVGTNMQCSAFMARFQAGDVTNPARYLGDAGVSTGGNPPVNTAFQLTVPAGTTIALVVFNVTVAPAGQGTTYQLIFDQDIFCQGQGTPTPSPSATPSGTPSPTPSGTPTPGCTPNPTPTPGTCVSYEAESCNNTLTG